MKIGFFTLGCKVNQFETQAMEQMLLRRGHTLGSFDEVCDAYVVNSCAVTATAEKKSRNALRRARQLNPRAVVGLCGCSGQVSPQAAEALGVDVLGGTGDRAGFLDALEAAASGQGRQVKLDQALQRRSFEPLPAGSLEGRTRALLKVQDGCVNFCTYCIIPYARGPVRSLPLQAAVAQAEAMAAAGYRELVVTGIEISSWGQDFHDSSSLKDLLAALCGAAPSLRVRLGSLEPRTVDESFCRMLAEKKNLCPQFHLSLQSGSDAVLERMGRKYDAARYLQSVKLLRASFPDCALTTDLIVGFPGETEAEFAQSLTFLQTCGFAGVHVFPYSRRTGTPAADMPGQLTAAQKADRAARAAAVVQALQTEHRRALVGKTLEVLFEQYTGTSYSGHAPDGTLVLTRGDASLHNQLRSVRIEGVCPEGVTGTLTEPFPACTD